MIPRRLLATTAIWLGAAAPLWAGDNAVVVTPGEGVALRSKDIGSNVQSMVQILGDLTGTPIASAAGTPNTTAVLPIQGTTGGVAVPISGTVTARAVGNAGGLVDTTAGATAPTNALQVGGVYRTSPPAPTNGQFEPLQLDSAGNLLVTNSATTPITVTVNTPPNDVAAGPMNFTGSGTLVVDSQGTGSTGLVVSGTFTGAAWTLQGSVDGTNWAAIPFFDNSASGVVYIQQPSAVATGSFVAPTAGFKSIRLNVTAIASGTLVASLNASAGSAQRPVGTQGDNSNISGVNGAVPLVGTGAAGSGSLRTTVAQDTTTIAGCAVGTPGTPNNTCVVSVQGVASGTAQPVSGTVAATESGTWTVQPGNTPNTTPWLFSPSTGGNTAAVKGASTPAGATDPALVVAISPNNTVAATQSGAWNLTNVSGTISLPTGAATATNQTNVQGSASGGTAAADSILAGGIYNSVAPTLSNGNQAALQLDSSGRVIVNVGAGSAGNAAASATGSAIPADAGYTGVNVGGTLRGLTGVNPTGTVYAGQVDIASIDGTALSSAALPITAAALPLPTGAATAANQTNAGQKTQIVDGSGNVIASTSNNLNVQCANCSSSGVTTADEAAFTAGASSFAGGGGFYQTIPTTYALTSGQQGMFQVTANRALFTNLRNAAGTEVGTAGAPIQVSVANTGLNGTPIVVQQATAASLNATVIGTGTFAVQAAQTGTWNINNVSGTVTLPTGAATAALQPTNAAAASTTAGQTGNLAFGAVTSGTPSYTTAQSDALSLTTAGALRVDGSAVTQPISGTVTVNAGTNLNTSLLALESGGNLATLAGTVTSSRVNDNARITGNAGGIIDFAGQNATSPANSVLAGAEYNSTPTTVTTGHASPLQMDAAGNLLVKVNANATVVGTGTFGVQASQSGTWTVQPGNTANTTPWLVTANAGTNLNTSALALDSSIQTMITDINNPPGCAVTTSAPTYTTGTTDPISCDTSGNLRIIGTITGSGLALDSSIQTMITDINNPPGCAVTTSAPTYTTGTTDPISCDTSGNLRITGTITAGGVSQGSTTSGQTGSLTQGAVTTYAPTYTTAQTDPISLDLSGNIRVTNKASSSKQSGTANTTGMGTTSLIAAVASERIYAQAFSCANTGSTASLISFQDGSGGTTIWTTIVPAGGGSNVASAEPMFWTTAGNALFFAAGSASTTVYCSVAGYAGN